MEKTLVLIKPDAFAKQYTGDIIQRYLSNGLKIDAMKLMKMTPELAAKHYEEHIGKEFYNRLVEFMTSAPLVALVLAGDDAIEKVRKINGKTDPTQAAPGTIRADYAENKTINAVHASDCAESAKREIALFFNKDEIFE